jgi:hypothetical protein
VHKTAARQPGSESKSRTAGHLFESAVTLAVQEHPANQTVARLLQVRVVGR